MRTKHFPLRVVLSITTGRLLTDVDDVYEILNWMTGDSLFTHQLPRAGEACKPSLLAQFPELQAVNACLANLDGWLAIDKTGTGSEGIKMWLAEIKMLFPEIKESYEVEPLPEGWTTIDPMIELESMVGKDRIVTVTY